MKPEQLIDIVVKNHVAGLVDCPVYMEYPQEPPERFAIVDKTDGSREDGLNIALFIAQSYGRSKLEAMMLNEQVKAAMDSLIELDRVAECDMSNDYPFPDTLHKKHRYQAVYEIVYY